MKRSTLLLTILLSVCASTALAQDPGSAEAYYNRGVVRLLQGKDAEADQDFEKGFQLDASLRASLEKFITETKRSRKSKGQ